jgi:flavodoxin
MKALIAYDSLSPGRCTEKVAQTVRDALVAKGIEAVALNVKGVDLSTLGGYDCLIVGSPINGWRPTPSVKEFLDKLSQAPAGRSAATFDTRIKSFFSGDAAGKMGKRLGSLGYRVVAPALPVYVKTARASAAGERSYELVEGELEKARVWAEKLADSLR